MQAGKRVEILHKKMYDRQRKKERRKTSAIGAGSMILTLCLFFMLFKDGMIHSGGPSGLYCGSTMMFEEAGPYILLAVGAFMAGVVFTVILKRYRRKKNDREA